MESYTVSLLGDDSGYIYAAESILVENVEDIQSKKGTIFMVNNDAIVVAAFPLNKVHSIVIKLDEDDE